MAEPQLVPDSDAFEPQAPTADEAKETPSPAPHPPLQAGPIPNDGVHTPRRLLVVGLVIALVVTGLALAIQSRRAGILAGEVAVLNAEVTAATRATEAYQIRFLQVRSEVGDLVSRVSALKSLVARDVVPAGISGAESDASPAPTYRD